MAPSPTGLQVLPHSVALLAEEALAASPRWVGFPPIFWRKTPMGPVFFWGGGLGRMINWKHPRFPRSRGTLGDTAGADPFGMLHHSGGIFSGRNEPGLFWRGGHWLPVSRPASNKNWDRLSPHQPVNYCSNQLLISQLHSDGSFSTFTSQGKKTHLVPVFTSGSRARRAKIPENHRLSRFSALRRFPQPNAML